jgi:Tfp pilus assembly protein PilF
VSDPGASALAAAEALRLLKAGQPEAALEYARRCVDGARVCLPAHGLLATVLMRLGRSGEAEQIIAHARTLGPGVADAYDALAFVSMALGRHQDANTLYRHATQAAGAEPRIWYNLACSERSLGRLAEAEAACDRAVALDQTQYPSYLLRSELRVQSPQANHIAELSARLQGAAHDYRARVFLGYALGKELDDLGRFDAAFYAFATAAGTRRSRLDYAVATDEHKLARIAACYPRANRDDAEGGRAGEAGERHIFIVGLPRSGTTLLERILSGLPGVRSNGETGNFSRALLAAARGAGDVFAQAAAADPHAVASGYARLAEPGPAAQHIIEKLPLNYLYLGAIRRALPRARLLLVSRAPLDSCFAMYRTLFAAGYPFSYDLAELGRYYAAYQGLMQHWRAALGDALHEISYEELVREPERVGAGVAQYCGLSWSAAALEIQNNKSVSLTASAAQVRRPIYGSSSGRWRHYRAHLGPLIDTLRAHAVALPE